MKPAIVGVKVVGVEVGEKVPKNIKDENIKYVVDQTALYFERRIEAKLGKML